MIFINPNIHKQAGLPDILNHERIHVDQNHWIDLCFIELLTVIFWFNPFIWLFERSIKQNHEYLADRGVLTRGSDLKRYQALLINQLMGIQIIGTTNNLNFALNTNRLKMMTKSQSKKIRSARYLLALPVIMLLLAAFAEPSYRMALSSQEEKTTEAINPSMKKTTVRGNVKTKDGAPLYGASIILKGTTTGTLADEEGNFSLEIPDDNECELVISFVGFASHEMKLPGNIPDNFFSEITMKREQILIGINELEKQGTPPPPPPPAKSQQPGTEEIFFVVEEMPSYPGGFYALAKHYQDIKSKTKEKFSRERKETTGNALMGFTVDTQGRVTNIKVLETSNDEVAGFGYQVLAKMKNWIPGKQRGTAVPVDYIMPVDLK
ncbi:MAG: M56 family metallopeptidase [Prolixibacteraceae bacterium]|nr:M56 family metallopeptidase [Prolixibacteraceae bacterium]